MGKTWETKKKILNLLTRRNKTLSEISEELHLAPSTVSEHIDELLRIGAILPVDNEYIRKWKYYKVNPSFDVATATASNRIETQEKDYYGRIVFGVLAVVIALGLYIILSLRLLHKSLQRYWAPLILMIPQSSASPMHL